MKITFWNKEQELLFEEITFQLAMKDEYHPLSLTLNKRSPFIISSLEDH